MANHGTKFETRHKLAREKVEAMKEIWRKSKPEYHGEMVNFDPMMTWPKPIQKPYRRSGSAAPFLRCAPRVRYGDGWMPHRRGPSTKRARHAAGVRQAHGRSRPRMPVTIWGAKEDEDMLKADRDAGSCA